MHFAAPEYRGRRRGPKDARERRRGRAGELGRGRVRRERREEAFRRGVKDGMLRQRRQPRACHHEKDGGERGLLWSEPTCASPGFRLLSSLTTTSFLDHILSHQFLAASTLPTKPSTPWNARPTSGRVGAGQASSRHSSGPGVGWGGDGHRVVKEGLSVICLVLLSCGTEGSALGYVLRVRIVLSGSSTRVRS